MNPTSYPNEGHSYLPQGVYWQESMQSACSMETASLQMRVPQLGPLVSSSPSGTISTAEAVVATATRKIGRENFIFGGEEV